MERIFLLTLKCLYIAVGDCKRRWTNIRDRYLKLKKAEKAAKKSGSGAKETKYWKFLKSMEFIESFTPIDLITPELRRV
jgi:hypothetical protein